MGQSYPDINGVAYSFSSVTIKVNGTEYYGATSFNYDDGLEPGVVESHGMTTPAAHTAGKWSGNASIEFNRKDGLALINALGNGFGRRVFQITATYADDNQPTTIDDLPAVRIKKVTNSNQAGTDPSKMNFELQVMAPIKRNGKAIERPFAGLFASA